jgi:hypothetical protein
MIMRLRKVTRQKAKVAPREYVLGAVLTYAISCAVQHTIILHPTQDIFIL